MPAKKKRKTVYREAYVSGAMKLKKEHLPDLKHTGGPDEKKFVATEVEFLAVGMVEEPDGTRREYQDMRIYVELEK